MESSSDESGLDIILQLSDLDTDYTDDTDDNADEEKQGPLSRSLKIGYSKTLNNAEFTFRFRLPQSIVEALLIEIMPFLRADTPRNHTVLPLDQLLLTLRFYALDTMLKSMEDFVGISTALAYNIVRDISIAITRLYDRYVVMHQASVNKFYKIARLPEVLGVIDCTHVRIPPSYFVSEDGEYKNRHGHFSLNVQAVCDADLKFMSIESRRPGSTHDALIFHKSDLKVKCEAGKFGKNWLLGDCAYPNKAYLMTPVPNPVTEAERRYNAAHTKTWSAIDITFGSWKRRFPIVASTVRLSQANASAVIEATAILYNISRNNHLADTPPEIPISVDRELPLPCDKSEQDTHQRSNLILKYFS